MAGARCAGSPGRSVLSRSRPISSAAAAASSRSRPRVEDLPQRVADGAHAGVGALGRVALGLELDADVDDPAGVADEVGRPQDPARGERGVERVGGELVVRGAGDRAAAQRGHGLVVEHAAERARRDDVDLGGHRRQRVGPLGAEPLGELALALVDVGDDELRAALGQHLGQPAADAAEPDHRDAAAVEVVGAERPLARDPQRDLAAERGPRARVARAALALASPVTCFVRPAMTSMSGSEVPTSSAVR